MGSPRVGVDGRRRLSVSLTLVDDEADLLWAIAYLVYGNASAGTSRFVKEAVRRAIREQADDPEVRKTVLNIRRYRAETAGRPALRLVRPDETALPD